MVECEVSLVVGFLILCVLGLWKELFLLFYWLCMLVVWLLWVFLYFVVNGINNWLLMFYKIYY